MEKSNNKGNQKDDKNMDGNNSEGNDSDKDESKRSDDCKDETDKESSGTEEEEEGENKEEQNHLRRREIEERKRREIEERKRREIEERKRRGRKPALHVTFSEGEGNSHQSEAADVRGEVLIEEEAGEGASAGESFWKKWKEAFRWNDFFYGLIFGLAPTSWDVLSDLRFGGRLANSGDLSSAGLCYVFVTIPGVFFLQEVIMLHIFKNCSSKVNTIMYVAYGFLTTTGMALGFGVEPLLFQYPATILGCSMIGVKLAGVFVHTPEMKAFSVRISAFEYTTESNLQLCLLFYLWLQLEKKMGTSTIFLTY